MLEFQLPPGWKVVSRKHGIVRIQRIKEPESSLDCGVNCINP